MTTIISEAPVCVELTNKSLISDQVWERLVSYIAKEKDMERPIAERIMDQTLGFLKLIALSPGRTFCPSKMVDIGWHAFHHAHSGVLRVLRESERPIHPS